MKPIPALLATLFLFGICANRSIIAADTNSSSAAWTGEPPRAATGYMLVRLETVAIKSGYEMGGYSVGATLQPIEFKYPDSGRSFGGGGGAAPAQNPFNLKPVQTSIGKSFYVWIISANSGNSHSQRSIMNLLKACADENDAKHPKLNLILSIPAAEGADWQKERDYSHWFIESLTIATK